MPWWSVAIPVTLTVVYLFLCRRAVRRANERSWEQAATTSGSVAPRRAIRVDASYGTPHEQVTLEISPDEDTISISRAAMAAALAADSADAAERAAAHALQMETVAVSVPTADGGSLWDPLPVTLPTYVTKERAARSVRTIDLNEPGSWTSGRSEEDSRLVAETAAEGAATAEEHAEHEVEPQRAVGS